VLSVFPGDTLELLYHGDQTKINELADFLISQEELNDQSEFEYLTGGNNDYQKKIDKLLNKEVDSVYDCMENLLKVEKLRKKQKKAQEVKCDLTLATYLNGKGKTKKFLNKNKYSSKIKKIAKAERREIKEMKKLGYIKTGPSVDDELKRLKKANRLMSDAIKDIYHDAYTQKYFIDE
jgi:hypothetical protein